MYDIYWKRPTMKNCLICNIEISENKKYCSRQCYNKNLKEMLISRNKSNIGKTWEEIMDKNVAELRRTKQSEKLKNNNPSSNPEIAKKISDKLKQVRKENPLTGEKNPFYGKKHSEEFKEKSSLTKKGKRSYNEEQFEKQNEKTPKGENHPNWKGGTSNQPYPFEFNKILKEDIKKRDNFMCGICSKETQKLAIHHINYDKNNIKFDNLISLCYSCHSKTNYNRDCWIEFFNKKININK
jgi:hypothetical protein